MLKTIHGSKGCGAILFLCLSVQNNLLLTELYSLNLAVVSARELHISQGDCCTEHWENIHSIFLVIFYLAKS